MASHRGNLMRLEAEISDVAGRRVHHKRDDIAFARVWSAGHLAQIPVLRTFYRLFRTVCCAGLLISSCALTFWI